MKVQIAFIGSTSGPDVEWSLKRPQCFLRNSVEVLRKLLPVAPQPGHVEDVQKEVIDFLGRDPVAKDYPIVAVKVNLGTASNIPAFPDHMLEKAFPEKGFIYWFQLEGNAEDAQTVMDADIDDAPSNYLGCYCVQEVWGPQYHLWQSKYLDWVEDSDKLSAEQKKVLTENFIPLQVDDADAADEHQDVLSILADEIETNPGTSDTVSDAGNMDQAEHSFILNNSSEFPDQEAAAGENNNDEAEGPV
ncbi:hypothetical protein [Pararcticibacter amylolyticus]|uniref:Uncharacterized protein n=1 Tax=Pararcticibacter amylolyticus TaxID=2173175 RepID=A0A2U2PB14_9SPHI|nr:hypothetical protein [Pararcticibacter amylolyticus]PWG78588.1 hypothetical protein DDR33_21740 [Pararcticibacter amylolyticus]